MDNLKNIAIGGVITLLVGGTAFTFNQQDVIDNLAEDTDLTQEQAEQYINNISEDELASFEEIGSDYISEGAETLALADGIDCINYEYEWESPTLSCATGKSQLQRIGNSEQSLGRAYMRLSSETASEDDMRTVIDYLNQLNIDYELEVAVIAFDKNTIDEMKMTNSYNKSLLRAALESGQN